MLRAIHGFLKHQDQGQDLAEYCLITGLIVLIALGMWDTANTTLAGNSNSGSGSAGTSDTQGNLGH